jgi:hypothetical protein
VLSVEQATADDLEPLLALAAARREVYATYQPRFWRPAADAVDRQRGYLRGLLEDDATLVVTARGDGHLHGFAVGRIVPAPPVYDPGGPTCVLDDFAVDHQEAWPEVGPPLLDAVRSWARSRGAAQLVVVTAHLDEAQRAALRAAGLGIASEWWVGALDDEPG